MKLDASAINEIRKNEEGYPIPEKVFLAIENGDFDNLCGEYPNRCAGQTYLLGKYDVCPTGRYCPHIERRKAYQRAKYLSSINFPETTFHFDDALIPEQLKLIIDKYFNNPAKRFANGNGLIIGGDCGTGKTTGMAYFAGRLFEQNDIDEIYEVKNMSYFIDAIRLADVLRGKSTDTPDERRIVINRAEIAPFLFIDDLCTEAQTALHSSDFYNLINSRYNNFKPTIITTNVSEQQIQQDKYLQRIYDRLSQRNPWVWVAGESKRKRASSKDW